MRAAFYAKLNETLADIDSQGLTKPERVILSRQGAEIVVQMPRASLLESEGGGSWPS